jgi:hypothetical protein
MINGLSQLEIKWVNGSLKPNWVFERQWNMQSEGEANRVQKEYKFE